MKKATPSAHAKFGTKLSSVAHPETFEPLDCRAALWRTSPKSVFGASEIMKLPCSSNCSSTHALRLALELWPSSPEDILNLKATPGFVFPFVQALATAASCYKLKATASKTWVLSPPNKKVSIPASTGAPFRAPGSGLWVKKVWGPSI